MKLYYVEGSYELSFFYICIKTEQELSKKVLELNKSTFLHEFIHYLQDLVLPYNIRLNLSHVRWFFNILDSAHMKGYIKRPFEEWNNESHTLFEQANRTIGGRRFINYVSKIEYPRSDYIEIKGYDSNLGKLRQHRVYQYNLPVLENDESELSMYSIGARDILEYIAYKIEVKNFPDRPKAPQLPYESIDLIFDKYGLTQIPDEIRVCIAERCLYNDAPMHYLIHMLLDDDEFKRFILNSSYKEIYDYLLKLETVTRDGQIESLLAKAQRRLKQFADELCTQYNGFDEIEKWIEKASSFVEHNFSGKFIFSDIYVMDRDKVFEFVEEVISCIGIPLVINSRDKYISIQSNEIEVSQFIQFCILEKFQSFVQSKGEKCPIYNFCQANGGTCNEKCIINKQKIIRGNENCYYRKFMETYGLLDVKID